MTHTSEVRNCAQITYDVAVLGGGPAGYVAALSDGGEKSLQQIINPLTDPAFNLAAEEYFLKRTDLKDDLFMLWRNEPAVVVGKTRIFTRS